ncbi:hypothetical protein KBB96_11100 [Luteolibacter ambystomatis]|uniref:Uncharacterized protein n=1 Tax=Luteolibacter ambystomatis TaxID=2824561 RepID=A0A975G5E0_9BACT|nr:hypothetical protein [Luteolibacter ambystomatis]QUE49419.1 hypothetical protein KBB96_11100 [Luteolibacter ambystomatis]
MATSLKRLSILLALIAVLASCDHPDGEKKTVDTGNSSNPSSRPSRPHDRTTRSESSAATEKRLEEKARDDARTRPEDGLRRLQNNGMESPYTDFELSCFLDELVGLDATRALDLYGTLHPSADDPYGQLFQSTYSQHLYFSLGRHAPALAWASWKANRAVIDRSDAAGLVIRGQSLTSVRETWRDYVAADPEADPVFFARRLGKKTEYPDRSSREQTWSTEDVAFVLSLLRDEEDGERIQAAVSHLSLGTFTEDLPMLEAFQQAKAAPSSPDGK